MSSDGIRALLTSGWGGGCGALAVVGLCRGDMNGE